MKTMIIKNCGDCPYMNDEFCDYLGRPIEKQNFDKIPVDCPFPDSEQKPEGAKVTTVFCDECTQRKKSAVKMVLRHETKTLNKEILTFRCEDCTSTVHIEVSYPKTEPPKVQKPEEPAKTTAPSPETPEQDEKDILDGDLWTCPETGGTFRGDLEKFKEKFGCDKCPLSCHYAKPDKPKDDLPDEVTEAMDY